MNKLLNESQSNNKLSDESFEFNEIINEGEIKFYSLKI